MDLPTLPAKLVKKYTPHQAIPSGKRGEINGIPLLGTGHPFYALKGTYGDAVIAQHPRKPNQPPVIKGIRTVVNLPSMLLRS